MFLGKKKRDEMERVIKGRYGPLHSAVASPIVLESTRELKDEASPEEEMREGSTDFISAFVP